MVIKQPSHSNTGLFSPVFKCHFNTGPFANRTNFDHLNTKLVRYSDGYCPTLLTILYWITTTIKLSHIWETSYIKVLNIKGWVYIETWSGDILIEMIGPLSSSLKVEQRSSRNPRTRTPVAPPDRTEKTWTTKKMMTNWLEQVGLRVFQSYKIKLKLGLFQMFFFLNTSECRASPVFILRKYVRSKIVQFPKAFKFRTKMSIIKLVIWKLDQKIVQFSDVSGIRCSHSLDMPKLF